MEQPAVSSACCSPCARGWGSRSCLEVDGGSRGRRNISPSGGILFHVADAVETSLPSCRAGIVIGCRTVVDSHHGSGAGIGARQRRQRHRIDSFGGPRWTVAPASQRAQRLSTRDTYSGRTPREHHLQSCMGGEPGAVHFRREARGLDGARPSGTRRPLHLARSCPRHPSRGVSPGRRRSRVGAPDGNSIHALSARAVRERLRTERRGEVTRRCVCGGPVGCVVCSGVGRALRLDGHGRIPDAHRHHRWAQCGGDRSRSHIAPASNSARSRRAKPLSHAAIGLAKRWR